MTTPPRQTRVLLIALLVLANNLAWAYLMRDMNSDTDLGRASAAQAAPMASEYQCARDGESGQPTLASEGMRHPVPAQMAVTTDAHVAAAAALTHSPLATATDGTDVPMQLSQDVILDRQTELKYFFQGDTARKLQTLEALNPQGEAIELLTQILRGEPDNSIRIAALNRLRHEHSYAATALVIHALDDPAAEVSGTALDTLVARGDRTLVPPLRTRYVQAIRALEYSASMEVDGVISH